MMPLILLFHVDAVIWQIKQIKLRGRAHSAFIVLLQYMLLSFIYFSKVKIADFLRSFRCPNRPIYIQFALNTGE